MVASDFRYSLSLKSNSLERPILHQKLNKINRFLTRKKIRARAVNPEKRPAGI